MVSKTRGSVPSLPPHCRTISGCSRLTPTLSDAIPHRHHALNGSIHVLLVEDARGERQLGMKEHLQRQLGVGRIDTLQAPRAGEVLDVALDELHLDDFDTSIGDWLRNLEPCPHGY